MTQEEVIYVARPPEYTAEQFHPDKQPWPKGVREYRPGSFDPREFRFGSGFGPPVDIHPGDWILTPLFEGELPIRSVCRADSFARMFQQKGAE